MAENLIFFFLLIYGNTALKLIYEICYKYLLNIWNQTCFSGWLGATTMQQKGDFVLYDTFETLVVFLKFTKIFTKEMTKMADNSIFFSCWYTWEVWDMRYINKYLTNIWNQTCFVGWLGATITQQRGDLVLCDTFEILDELSKFTKTSTKEMTKMADDSVFFFLLIYRHTALKSLIYEIC